MLRVIHYKLQQHILYMLSRQWTLDVTVVQDMTLPGGQNYLGQLDLSILGSDWCQYLLHPVFWSPSGNHTDWGPCDCHLFPHLQTVPGGSLMQIFCKLHLVAASRSYTCAQDDLDTVQLALVVFFLPSTSANTLLAVMVVIVNCNLRWWHFSLEH